MKRFISVLAVAAVMAAMMGVSALPALAQGPPNQAVTKVLQVAEDSNPVIDIKGNNACLNTPGPGIGHHSGYPKDSPCEK